MEGWFKETESSLARESFPSIFVKIDFSWYCLNRVNSASPFYYILHQENIFRRSNWWKTEGGRMIPRDWIVFGKGVSSQHFLSRLASLGDCSNRVIFASPLYYTLHQENIFRGRNSWKTGGGRMIPRDWIVFGKGVSSINSCEDSFLLVLFESRKIRESIVLYCASGEYLQKEHFTKDWRWKWFIETRLCQGSQLHRFLSRLTSFGTVRIA